MRGRTERLSLPAVSPGTERTLLVHRFGKRGARPKAYLQAGLHADELPGLLVLHHLLALLETASANGGVRGEIVVVPYANPIGLSQFLDGHHMGRYELGGGENFNRDFAHLGEAAAALVDGRLGPDPARNVALIRAALVDALKARRAAGETSGLRAALLRLAIDADIVLDLHCDGEAPLHLYLIDDLWPGARDLCADLGAEAVLLARESGGEPFDEACSAPWWQLAQRFGPGVPIPVACLAATVELRGQDQVADRWARPDAAALFRFLQRRGLLDGDPGPLPELRCEATPLSGADIIRAPGAGIVSYTTEPGARVGAGEPVAELCDPMAKPGAPRVVLTSRVDGVVYSRRRTRLVRPGDTVVRVAGREPLPERGDGPLLE